MKVELSNSRSPSPQRSQSPSGRAGGATTPSLAERSFFEPIRRGNAHLDAVEALDRHVPRLLGAFAVSCDPANPKRVRVESERLEHLGGAVKCFQEAANNLRQQGVWAAVAAVQGSAEAASYSAALGAACAKPRLDAAAWVCAVSIVAQNHIHGPMLERQVARGRMAANDPRVMNWREQKEKQPFYEQIATATEAFARDDVLEKAPAWNLWKDEQITNFPS